MRHFGHLDAAQDDAVFHQLPVPFDGSAPREQLALALGATLYTPGTQPDYAKRMHRLRHAGVTSSVLCLEDAISDADVPLAARNVVDQLTELAERDEDLPLLFVRVRHPEQIGRLVAALGDAVRVLTGFVFPKFTAGTGRPYLEALGAARSGTGHPLYGMPVLETGEVLYAESRIGELVAVRTLLDAYAASVLAVRIGATDLCGLYGLRREAGLTVYDLAVVRAAIADIVNVCARDGAFTVTGAVWEQFRGGTRLLKPQLRSSPFSRPDLPSAPEVRHELVRSDLDGLLREVVLDKATGILGKTVIHPTHVRAVHSQYVVTHEEFTDAHATLALAGGGAVASALGTRMVEGKPHARWASGVLRRAAVFGVLRPDRTFVDLLDVEEVAP